jgi:hypothetical protein
MLFISHRGNLNGKNKDIENNPIYINEIIKKYNVEIDVWKTNDGLFLGHDLPQYKIDEEFLVDNKDKFIIHCKNDDALFYLKNNKLHIFYHTNDEFTISNKNIIMVNPISKTIYNEGILMMPEMSNYSLKEIFSFNGIISDNILFYESYYNTVRKQ